MAAAAPEVASCSIRSPWSASPAVSCTRPPPAAVKAPSACRIAPLTDSTRSSAVGRSVERSATGSAEEGAARPPTAPARIVSALGRANGTASEPPAAAAISPLRSATSPGGAAGSRLPGGGTGPTSTSASPATMFSAAISAPSPEDAPPGPGAVPLITWPRARTSRARSSALSVFPMSPRDSTLPASNRASGPVLTTPASAKTSPSAPSRPVLLSVPPAVTRPSPGPAWATREPWFSMPRVTSTRFATIRPVGWLRSPAVPRLTTSCAWSTPALSRRPPDARMTDPLPRPRAITAPAALVIPASPDTSPPPPPPPPPPLPPATTAPLLVSSPVAVRVTRPLSAATQRFALTVSAPACVRDTSAVSRGAAEASTDPATVSAPGPALLNTTPPPAPGPAPSRAAACPAQSETLPRPRVRIAPPASEKGGPPMV